MSRYPYGVSKKISLMIDDTFSARATILHIYEPFNSSCTMNLLFDSDLSCVGIQGKVVLKLFDRRHAAGLRRASGAIPWSSALETRYARMIMDGTPAVVQAHLIKRLKAFDNNPSVEVQYANSPRQSTDNLQRGPSPQGSGRA